MTTKIQVPANLSLIFLLYPPCTFLMILPNIKLIHTDGLNGLFLQPFIILYIQDKINLSKTRLLSKVIVNKKYIEYYLVHYISLTFEVSRRHRLIGGCRFDRWVSEFRGYGVHIMNAARTAPGSAPSEQRTPGPTTKGLRLRDARTGREHSGDFESTT